MSVAVPSAAPERAPARPRFFALSRLLSLRRPRLALGVIVGLSAVVQTLLAWTRPTPGYFPDEYIYAEIGRSLSEGAGPAVRDGASNFAPLLYPLLTAPIWLIGEVSTAYHAVQTLNAVAMSLAAVPVFLIARRLQLGDWLAIGCAALAVVAPALLYSAWTMAEPVAYTLALSAVACGLAVLDRPTFRLQVAFLALAGLAAFTRLQLAAIPLAYLLAAALVAVRERRIRATLTGQWLALGVLGTGVAVAGVAGLRGHFGYYPSFTYIQIDFVDALQALGANALVLCYSAGWAIVPPALLGLALALARPRSRAELAFGALAASLTILFLVEASLYGDTANVQERYFVYAVPLLALAFSLYARRDWPLLRAHALLVAMAAAAIALVPLAGFAAAQGSAQSLLLGAHQGAAIVLGDVAVASLAFAVVASGLSVLVLLVAWRNRPRAALSALAVTLAAFVALSAAAFSFFDQKRAAVRAQYLPADRSWVDQAQAGGVTLLLSPLGSSADAHSTLFWNRSIERMLLLKHATAPDVFSAPGAAVDGAGRLSVGGEPVTGPLLVDIHGTSIELRDATRLAGAQTKTLWQPRGAAQLRLFMSGRFYDGPVAAKGLIRVWPRDVGGRVAGWVELELRGPDGLSTTNVRVRVPDGRAVTRAIQPGQTELVRVPACSRGVWSAPYTTASVALAHGGLVGPEAAVPRFVEDSSACAGRTP